MTPDLDYLPGPMLAWAEANTWLLDTVAAAWLATGEAPKQADLQQQAMALGLDIWIGGVLEQMPKPLGWVDGGDRRLVLSIIGLRLTPCMAEPMRGLGPLVALAVERFRTGDPALTCSPPTSSV